MSRKKIPLLAAVAAAVVLGTVAPAASAGHREERSLRLARAAWGFPAHCDQSGVLLSYRLMPRGVLGYAGEFCAIYLNLRYDYRFRALCTIVVHEFGHVHGYGHMDAFRDVMNSSYDETPYWWRCLSRRERRRFQRLRLVDRRLNKGSYPYIGRPGVDALRLGRLPAERIRDVTPDPAPSRAPGPSRLRPAS